MPNLVKSPQKMLNYSRLVLKPPFCFPRALNFTNYFVKSVCPFLLFFRLRGQGDFNLSATYFVILGKLAKSGSINR